MPKQLEKKKTTELEHRAIELSRSGSHDGAGEKFSLFTTSQSKEPQPKLETGNSRTVELSTGLLVEFELVDKYQSKFTQEFKFKYRLRHQGIPLYGSSIIVDLDEDNRFLFANSSDVAQDEAVKKGFPDKNPKVAKEALKDLISKYYHQKGERISLDGCDINPDLYYYFKHFSNGSTHKLGEWRLVYVTNIKVMAPTGGEKSVGTSPELTDYVIDAHTGEIILELSNLRTFC